MRTFGFLDRRRACRCLLRCHPDPCLDRLRRAAPPVSSAATRLRFALRSRPRNKSAIISRLRHPPPPLSIDPRVGGRRSAGAHRIIVQKQGFLHDRPHSDRPPRRSSSVVRTIGTAPARRRGAGRRRRCHRRACSGEQSSCPTLSRRSTTTAAAAAHTATESWRRLPAGSRFQPLMTLYLTDHTGPARNRCARKRPRSCTRSKYYPAGATTQFRLGRDRDRACVSGARRDGEARCRAVAARRSHRPGRRHIRPRARLRRTAPCAHRARISRR